MHEIDHRKFMEHALDLARISAKLGEVPVGSVVVIDNQIVAQGINCRELLTSCVEHAEMRALGEACRKLGRWRLVDATVYTTLEPCIMCAGALLHGRVRCVVYGASDAKFGAIDSLYRLGNDPRLNHQIEVISGLMAFESAQLLKEFFKGLRDNPV
ncbi:MAG TPA: nucleoside deaminase [Myxococcota bacterium]|nr:nucleoside deaminase [Myxococcota bacterium]